LTHPPLQRPQRQQRGPGPTSAPELGGALEGAGQAVWAVLGKRRRSGGRGQGGRSAGWTAHAAVARSIGPLPRSMLGATPGALLVATAGHADLPGPHLRSAAWAAVALAGISRVRSWPGPRSGRSGSAAGPKPQPAVEPLQLGYDPRESLVESPW